MICKTGKHEAYHLGVATITGIHATAKADEEGGAIIRRMFPDQENWPDGTCEVASLTQSNLAIHRYLPTIVAGAVGEVIDESGVTSADDATVFEVAAAAALKLIDKDSNCRGDFQSFLAALRASINYPALNRMFVAEMLHHACESAARTLLRYWPAVMGAATLLNAGKNVSSEHVVNLIQLREPRYRMPQIRMVCIKTCDLTGRPVNH